ncbi:hypothetical protein [Laspinema olomoucense]|uniref:hypothetical protein n=1 Tax=Laspinema olomoucense TaxID=3231600 RepID=UPI0021BA548D|nr:hypothetical protein [Laspinema sp. D3c]MCT7992449.1 hypothetical protein [Laspinema sp. D3c]
MNLSFLTDLATTLNKIPFFYFIALIPLGIFSGWYRLVLVGSSFMLFIIFLAANGVPNYYNSEQFSSLYLLPWFLGLVIGFGIKRMLPNTEKI